MLENLNFGGEMTFLKRTAYIFLEFFLEGLSPTSPSPGYAPAKQKRG